MAIDWNEVARAVGAGFKGYYTGKHMHDQREMERADREERRRLLGLQIEQARHNLDRDRSLTREADEIADMTRGQSIPTARPINPATIEAAAGAPDVGFSSSTPRRGPPASQADINRATARLALRKGDVRGYNDALTFARGLDEDDAFKRGATAPMTPQTVEEITRWVSATSPRITAAPGKGGYVDISIADPNGGGSRFSRLSPAQVRKVMGAVALFDLNPARALEQLGAVDKDLAAAVAADNNLVAQVSTAQNQVNRFRHGDEVDAARLNLEGQRLGIDRARLGLERDRLAQSQQDARLGRMGTPQPVIGQDGQPAFMVPTMTPQGMRMEVVPVPPGYRVPRQVDPAQQRNLAMDLVGQPTGRTVAGKPEVYTPEMAYHAAGAMLRGETKPTVGPNVAADVELLQRYMANPQPARKDNFPSGNKAFPSLGRSPRDEEMVNQLRSLAR